MLTGHSGRDDPRLQIQRQQAVLVDSFSVQEDQVELAQGAWAASQRLAIRWRGKRILSLSQGPYRHYLYPVFTPAGFAVTSESPADHPHHNSIWVALDRVRCLFPYSSDETEEGTYNFYVNETFQGRTPGRILTTVVKSEELAPDHLRIVLTLQWRGPEEWAASGGRVLLNETRTLDIRPGVEVNLVDVRSRLEAGQWALELGPTRHGLFGVRLIEALAVTHGGTLLDSAGREGGREISRGKAGWVDGSGTLGRGIRAGVALIPHPSTAGHPWYVTDWGTLTINPMAGRVWPLEAGQGLEFGLRIAVHDGDAGEARVREIYRAFQEEFERED